MMTRADYERFLSEAPALLDERFRLDNTRTREDFPFMFTKMVMPGTLLIPEADKNSKYRMPFFLDILPLDEIPADEKAFQEMSRQSWLWGRLLFLQGTPRPHLINTPAWKKALIFSATTLAHLGLKAIRATPASLQARWERAVRRYEGTGTGVYADFTMRDPQNWIVREEEFFPTRDVPFEDITVMIQNEYDALVSFAYNIGSIDGLTASGSRSKDEIADKFLAYNRAGGKVLSGLTRRRQEERALSIIRALKNNINPLKNFRFILPYWSQ